MSKEEVKIGDIIMLNCDKTKMVVAYYNEILNEVECVWLNTSGEVQRAWFNLEIMRNNSGSGQYNIM